MGGDTTGAGDVGGNGHDGAGTPRDRATTDGAVRFEKQER